MRMQAWATFLWLLLVATLPATARGQVTAGGECLEYSNEDGHCIRYKARQVKVQLSVSGTPAEAKVKLKGKSLCERLPCTPKPQAVPSDPVELLIYAPNYQSKIVQLGSAGKWSDQVALKRCPEVVFRGVPKGSEIWASDILVGKWPDSFPEPELVTQRVAEALHQERDEDSCPLRPQQLSFKVAHPNFTTWTSPPLEVAFDKLTAVEPKLERKTGSIVVWSAIGNATVLLDGKRVLTLPTAGLNDLVVEIQNVSVDVTHTVSLKMDDEELPDAQLWGDFPHEVTVVVETGKTSYVGFQVPVPQQPSHVVNNPVKYTVNVKQLSELCESNASACLALGWARRWGVGSSVDAAAAAEAFNLACFERRGSDASKLEACTALAWMVEAGLVAPNAGRKRDDETSIARFKCASRFQFAEDRITPCIRARLSHESQMLVDPTLYVSHDAENQSGGFPVLVLGGLGAKQRLLRGGIGVAASAGPFIIDVWLTGGWASYQRWDRRYGQKRWDSAGTLGFEFGPAFRLAPYAYCLAHFTGDGVIYSREHPTANGSVYGARLALGVTLGNVTRHKLFLELGLALQSASHEVTNPGEHDLIEQLLKDRDLDTFERNWKRLHDAGATFMWTPSVLLGWSFGT